MKFALIKTGDKMDVVAYKGKLRFDYFEACMLELVHSNVKNVAKAEKLGAKFDKEELYPGRGYYVGVRGMHDTCVFFPE